MTSRGTRDELAGYIGELQILDSHEHLPNERDRPAEADVLAEWLIHYFSCDLVSAGLSDDGLARARDSRVDLLARWDLVEPYWEAARTTGYGRSLDLAARDLYGVDGVRRQTLGRLNEAFVAARERGGHYRYVLKEKGRIALSLVDSNLECDREFFATAVRLDHFIMPTHRCEIRNQGRDVGVQVHSLEDWEEALRRQLGRAFDQGAVVVKHGLAYMRSLLYEKTTRAEAEREFQEFFRAEHAPEWRLPLKAGRALQRHMMHALLRLADQQGLTVQVHTGLQEGNGNVIVDANPVNLTNCFLEYENVTFDLFHMGYPYTQELSNLAKNFRNVTIDMCWGHIISPEAARRALIEWLDAVPANKIIGFGGDYCFVDGVYGHQHLARQNIAAALATKVADGSFDLERAKEIARWLLVDNPTRILRLADRVPGGKS
ncbi:MAG: amidohydrolase [Candidatus Latescibacterota bacterium]|jgi:predicted TIM-barrel fold metal-dependent hydrolase